MHYNLFIMPHFIMYYQTYSEDFCLITLTQITILDFFFFKAFSAPVPLAISEIIVVHFMLKDWNSSFVDTKVRMLYVLLCTALEVL